MPSSAAWRAPVPSMRNVSTPWKSPTPDRVFIKTFWEVDHEKKPLDSYAGNVRQPQQLAKYILEDPSLVMQYNIRELAARLYVSPATVVRLSQTLGFKGYREFKQAMVYGLAQYENNGKEHLSDIGRQKSQRKSPTRTQNPWRKPSAFWTWR